MTTSALPLWQQLQASAQVLRAVLHGQSVGVVLERTPNALRAATQALSFTALRHLGVAQALLDALVARKPNTSVQALLLCTLALLEANQPQPGEASSDLQAPLGTPPGAAYPAFTLVAQSVEAAKRRHDMRFSARMVNACLRRYLREREDLLQTLSQTEKHDLIQWNHPAWWVALLQADQTPHWQSILSANRMQAPLHIRVNVLCATPQAYLRTLAKEGLAAVQIGPAAVQLQQAVAVDSLPGFAQGVASVQDAGAQVAVPLLLDTLFAQTRTTKPYEDILLKPIRLKESVQKCYPKSIWRVLDACAAPGGKTVHLLEYAQSQQQTLMLTALDIDSKRCVRIRENLERVGMQAQVLVADAVQTESWWDGVPFDAILLDAPCTASGIVRRHPDVAWLRRAEDVAALALRQAQLLKRLWPLLGPSAYLLYAVCSVFAQEGSDQIRWFLQKLNQEVRLLRQLQLFPSLGGSVNAKNNLSDSTPSNHDGFYYALLQKNN